MSNENDNVDALCADCPEALSDFLQGIAEHNAKVTACPKCGKNHALKPQKAAAPVSAVARVSVSKSKRSSTSKVRADINTN